MTTHPTRRSVLSALGVTLPWGLGATVASASSSPDPLTLRFRPFEAAVRDAFADAPPQVGAVRRVEVGPSDLLWSGLPGSHNDRPFAGFPAGHLRLIRVDSAPGPICQGIRFHVTTVDFAVTGGLSSDTASRPFNFASLPPTPILT